MTQEQLIQRNNITITGKGDQTMLLVHGYGCDQNMWRFIVPAFKEAYQIMCIDLVGSGKSDQKAYDFNKYNHLSGYADDLLEICDAFQLKRVIIVGHSVSAMIALLAAKKRPEYFASLILVGPSPCYINDGDYTGGFSRQDIDELIDSLESNYLGWSSAIAPVIMNRPDKPEFAEELANSFCRNNPDIAKHFARVTFLSDNRKDLDGMDIPCLIIQCTADVIAPRSVGEYLHRKILGSHLAVLEATGHCPHLSAPEETIRAMRDFLKNQI